MLFSKLAKFQRCAPTQESLQNCRARLQTTTSCLTLQDFPSKVAKATDLKIAQTEVPPQASFQDKLRALSAKAPTLQSCKPANQHQHSTTAAQGRTPAKVLATCKSSNTKTDTSNCQTGLQLHHKNCKTAALTAALSAKATTLQGFQSNPLATVAH